MVRFLTVLVPVGINSTALNQPLRKKIVCLFFYTDKLDS